jgi:hypothetical protein
VVVSIAPQAYQAMPVLPLAGKPVLDTINYIPSRDERIPGLGGSLSSSDVLQRHLGTAHVVTAFNSITFWHLASVGPGGKGEALTPTTYPPASSPELFVPNAVTAGQLLSSLAIG